MKIKTDKRMALFVVVMAAVALYVINPEECAFVPKCPFKLITGLNCPGCGFQRAVHSLLHGEIAKAVEFNVFLVCSIPYLMALCLQRWVLTGKWQYKAGKILECRPMVAFCVTTVLVWFVVRNILNI